MVSLHNIKDEQKLFQLIKTVETPLNIKDWYWTGFNDRGTAGYSWTDGTGDDYTNWAAGQPEKSATGEECMILVSDSSDNPAKTGWFSDYCVQQRGVICAVTRGHQPNPLPTAPPTIGTDPLCMSTGGLGEVHYFRKIILVRTFGVKNPCSN